MKRKIPVVAVLRALLRNYRRCVENPRICRLLIYRRQYFEDDFVAAVVMEILLCSGRWEDLKKELSSWRSDRAQKFLQWAAKVRGGAL